MSRRRERIAARFGMTIAEAEGVLEACLLESAARREAYEARREDRLSAMEAAAWSGRHHTVEDEPAVAIAGRGSGRNDVGH